MIGKIEQQIWAEYRYCLGGEWPSHHSNWGTFDQVSVLIICKWTCFSCYKFSCIS